jgi:DNA-binding MarR family transcriptional regulator
MVHDETTRRRFRSAAQEAGIAILRTADEVRRALSAAVEPHGITLQQYNVLRILRGAAGAPMPTLDIADRMIERTPGITRLIDRLEARALVRRERCPNDRRLVHCSITREGSELLAAVQADFDAAEQAAAGMLSSGEHERLLELLGRIQGSGPA